MDERDREEIRLEIRAAIRREMNGTYVRKDVNDEATKLILMTQGFIGADVKNIKEQMERDNARKNSDKRMVRAALLGALGSFGAATGVFLVEVFIKVHS